MEETEEKIEYLKAMAPMMGGEAKTKKKGAAAEGMTDEQQELAYLEKMKAEKIKIATFYQKLLY